MTESVNALGFTQPAARMGGDSCASYTRGVNNYRFPNSSERHFDGQNLYGGMKNVGNPFTSSDDHLLATDLKNDLPLLDPFKKDGKLTLACFNDAIASSTLPERTRKLLEAILNRPRIKEAITEKGGEITVDRLSDATKILHGNTDPNIEHKNPFESKSNRQVAEALLSVFPDWRDKDYDLNVGSEKHWYVSADKIKEIASNPDFTNVSGNVVIDPVTRSPRKKYRAYDVHLANALMDRPELRASLDDYKANGYNPFGSLNHDGWYKNYSIERWIDNDKAEKGE